MMSSSRGVVVLLFALIVSVAGISTALAQEDAQPDRQPRERRRDLVSALRFWRMVDALELKEDEIPRAMAQVKAIDATERDFRQQRSESLERIARLLRDENASESALRDEVAKLRASEDTFRQERTRRRDELLAGLSPKQQASFWVFEDEFPRHLRALREKARRGDRGGEPGDLPFRRERQRERREKSQPR